MPTRLLVLAMVAALAAPSFAGAQTAAGATTATPQTGSAQTPTSQPGTSSENAPATGAPATAAPGTRAPATAPPTTATAPSSAQQAAAALPPDYRLAIGDKLRVEVYKDPQLSQSLQVRPDGKVTLPLIGDIAAAGLTSVDLRERIASALKEYVTNPVVTVIVVETVPPVVYVMGEVTNPGAVP